jgi:hypothetical protein
MTFTRGETIAFDLSFNVLCRIPSHRRHGADPIMASFLGYDFYFGSASSSRLMENGPTMRPERGTEPE